MCRESFLCQGSQRGGGPMGPPETWPEQGHTDTPACLQGCGPPPPPKALQDATSFHSHKAHISSFGFVGFYLSNTILMLRLRSLDAAFGSGSGGIFPPSFHVHRPRCVHTHHTIHTVWCLHFNGFTSNIRHSPKQCPGRSITAMVAAPFLTSCLVPLLFLS